MFRDDSLRENLDKLITFNLTPFPNMVVFKDFLQNHTILKEKNFILFIKSFVGDNTFKAFIESEKYKAVLYKRTVGYISFIKL